MKIKDGLIHLRFVVRSCFDLFPTTTQRKLYLYGFFLLVIGILDLIAVAAIGLLGSLAITGVQSRNPTGLISRILEALSLGDKTIQIQAASLGGAALLLLVSKTAVATITTKNLFLYMGTESAQLSEKLLLKAFNLPLARLRSLGSHNFLYAITQGVSNISFGVIGVFISMTADFGVLILLTLGIILINPLMAGVTLFLFGILGLFLTYAVGGKARSLGQQSSQLYIRTSYKIDEALDSFHILYSRNNRFSKLTEISKDRFILAKVNAELAFLPNVSKYVIESGIFISGMVVSAVEFILVDAVHAVAALALFMGTGSRIAPAMLRIQQGIIQLRSNLGTATPTIDLIEELESVSPLGQPQRPSSIDFRPEIVINHLTYKYDEDTKFHISVPECKIDEGSFTAIVGRSGSGKSTLVDLILGLNRPNSGSVTISGENPEKAIELWPSSIAYVPQNVFMISGSLRENISYGYPKNHFSDDEIIDVLRILNMNDLTFGEKIDLNMLLEAGGRSLSGGQKQRIGIARALLGNPKLLVLDEATSALDAQTENHISEVLRKLRGTMTIIVIAHRLSTVTESDSILYMDHGKILHKANFNELRRIVPDFESQANLLGI